LLSTGSVPFPKISIQISEEKHKN